MSKLPPKFPLEVQICQPAQEQAVERIFCGEDSLGTSDRMAFHKLFAGNAKSIGV